MSDVSGDLWQNFASVVAGATKGGDQTDNEQILPMLVALPLEADWFDVGELTESKAPQKDPADLPVHVLAEHVEKAAAAAAVRPGTALAVGAGITIPDPDDLSTLLNNPPDPGNSLDPAKVDDDGQATGRGNPMYADNSRTKTGVSGLTQQQQNFIDTVAFLPGQYGPLWAPGSVRVADAYKSLLLNISIGNMTADANSKVTAAFKAFSKATNGFSAIQLKAAQAYQSYATQMRSAGMTPDPIAKFLADNGYQDQLAAALTKRNSDYATFRQTIEDVGLREDLIDAVSALKSDLPQLFVMSTVADPPSKWTSYTQDSKQVTEDDKSSITKWGVSASGAYSLISFGGSAGGSTEHSTVSTKEIDISVEFAGIKQVTIIPGVAEGQTWANNAVVSKYVGHLKENGLNQWAATSVFAGQTPNREPYGASGFLPFWPTGAVVVYKPKITLTMKTTEFSKDATSWNAGLDIGIGPFKFGPSVSQSNVSVHTEGDSTSISLIDDSEVPKVLAFLMQVMPPGAAD